MISKAENDKNLQKVTKKYTSPIFKLRAEWKLCAANGKTKLAIYLEHGQQKISQPKNSKSSKERIELFYMESI